jgi:hypothetical protein
MCVSLLYGYLASVRNIGMSDNETIGLVGIFTGENCSLHGNGSRRYVIIKSSLHFSVSDERLIGPVLYLFYILSHCYNSDFGSHCWNNNRGYRVDSDTIFAFICLLALQTSSPVMWRKVCLWNFSVLQRVTYFPILCCHANVRKETILLSWVNCWAYLIGWLLHFVTLTGMRYSINVSVGVRLTQQIRILKEECS